MADTTVPPGGPSLRRRFAVWFGTVFLLAAIALRVSHFRATVDSLERDLDVALWSRLVAVKAQERFAPDTLGEAPAAAAGALLPDRSAAEPWAPPRLLGIPLPPLEPPADPGGMPWFAGVWRSGGELLHDIGLPAGLAWSTEWAGRLDTLWTAADGRHRLAATRGGHDTVIVVGAALEGIDRARRDAARFQLLTFVFGVPLVFGAGWLALARVLVPPARIAATARRIRAGRFEERIEVVRTDAEFKEMAAALNDMLDRLDAIRDAQACFNADVAHQFMNPVHAIMLEADAAAAAPRTAEDLTAALVRVGGLARRLESLCEALLAWSRSATLDPGRLSRVDLEPIVAAAADRVAARAADRGVAIGPPPAGVVVRGDPALLEEVFLNLLANAVAHAPAGSLIGIEAREDPAGSRVAVVDHGSGVAAADLPRLFARFESGTAGGHGIGLALSRTILRSHGGDLVHAPTPGGGATFTLSFPPAG
jgi:signal transduction histidine kinase